MSGTFRKYQKIYFQFWQHRIRTVIVGSSQLQLSADWTREVGGTLFKAAIKLIIPSRKEEINVADSNSSPLQLYHERWDSRKNTLSIFWDKRKSYQAGKADFNRRLLMVEKEDTTLEESDEEYETGTDTSFKEKKEICASSKRLRVLSTLKNQEILGTIWWNRRVFV